MKKCVFFDRDGIVNKPPSADYVACWDQFEFDPAFPEILRLVTEWGYVSVVITNQRGVALGRLTRETLEGIHSGMRRRLRDEHDLDFLDVFYCPHDNDECECRKPKPGMLIEAAHRHDIDLSASWMIGDSERDITAGRAAGCSTIFVARERRETAADYSVAAMSDLAMLLRDLRAKGEM